MSGWIAKSANDGDGRRPRARGLGGRRDLVGRVASVTSVMGLFRSAGARCAVAGAAGRSEVFGGRAASGTPGARHVKELGSSCRPGTVDTAHSTVRLRSHGAHLDRGPHLPRRRRRPAGRPRLRRADRVHPDGGRLRPRARRCR